MAQSRLQDGVTQRAQLLLVQARHCGAARFGFLRRRRAKLGGSRGGREFEDAAVTMSREGMYGRPMLPNQVHFRPPVAPEHPES